MSDQQRSEKAIFRVASSIESTEVRHDYLGQVCGDNPELLGRVATLLRMQAEEPGFLEAPAPGPSSAPTSSWSRSAKGAWVWSIWPSKSARCGAWWR
jgi:hypothetical protein